jgi:hypothetical protein
MASRHNFSGRVTAYEARVEMIRINQEAAHRQQEMEKATPNSLYWLRSLAFWKDAAINQGISADYRPHLRDAEYPTIRAAAEAWQEAFINWQSRNLVHTPTVNE